MYGIRYASHPLVLYLFISLAYWKWIDFWCHTVYCGPPQAIGSFLRNTNAKLNETKKRTNNELNKTKKLKTRERNGNLKVNLWYSHYIPISPITSCIFTRKFLVCSISKQGGYKRDLSCKL